VDPKVSDTIDRHDGGIFKAGAAYRSHGMTGVMIEAA